MTDQEIFDKVATHLLNQNEQSVKLIERFGEEIEVCQYRSDNGLKCAAGCLIPDDLYRSEFEGNTWDCLAAEIGGEFFKSFSPENNYLISRLQGLHDTHEPRLWKDELENLAEQFDLNINAII